LALLVDNDIVHKLAQLDLLQEAEELLRAEFGELKVLDTLKYIYCHPTNPKVRAKSEQKHGINVVNRIEAFLKKGVSQISCPVTDEALIEILEKNPKDLDEEMQLLQALFDGENELLFTGDKRFLKALSNAELLEGKLQQINGKFVCFEQIIYFLVTKLGFEQVKIKYIQALETGIKIDATLKQCFEGQHQAIEKQVIQNLNIHINYIRKDSGQLLSPSEKWQLNYEASVV
jgi:hypothetical protein